MTSTVISDMLTLISSSEHTAPTRRYVDLWCLDLDPLDPHYTSSLAPNLQLRTDHHGFTHLTAN